MPPRAPRTQPDPVFVKSAATAFSCTLRPSSWESLWQTKTCVGEKLVVGHQPTGCLFQHIPTAPPGSCTSWQNGERQQRTSPCPPLLSFVYIRLLRISTFNSILCAWNINQQQTALCTLHAGGQWSTFSLSWGVFERALKWTRPDYVSARRHMMKTCNIGPRVKKM